MANILYGSDAVAQVEAAEGPLSSTERRIVELEGLADGTYADTKGIATSGVGQTGQFANMSFKDTVATFEEETRRMIPNFDSLSPKLQTELVQAAYRGDLQQSPKTRALINEGNFEGAAQEFLNNQEFQTTPYNAIRDRMADVSTALAAEGAQAPVAPSVGEQKQVQLANRTPQKQQQVANTSDSKQLELAGLSQAEQRILDLGMSEYVRNGQTGTAASRAQEYMDAQDKLSTIQQRQDEESTKVIFEDLDNPLQATGNTLLSVANTIGNIAGGLVSLPSSIRSAYNLSDATNEGFAQYQSILAKEQAGVALTPAEREFQGTDEYSDIKQGMESMARAQSIQGGFGILGDYVNQELTTEFVNEGSKLFNEVAGGDITMGEFISESARLLTQSPGAIGQATVESLPYVLASAYNLPLTVASGWANNQQEALEEYQKNNDGAIPTGRDLANVTMLAGGQALVDHFGDRLVGGKNLKNLISGATGRRSAGAAVGVVQGTAGEFVAEGGAEVLGQLAATAGKGEVDLAQAYAAGLLGAGAGGATSGAIAGANITADAIDNAPDLGEKVSSVSERAKGAVESVKTAATEAKDAATKAAQTTTEEQTEAPTEEKGLDVRLSEAFVESDSNPDQAQTIEADVRAEYDALKTEAQDIVKSGVTNETITEEQKDTIIRFQEAQKVIRARNKEVKAREAAKQANQLATASTNNTATTTAVENVLGSIELDPSSISADQAEAILGNQNLRLDAEQRSKLQHHVRVAKTLDEVSNEIRDGGNGNIGINQYIEEVGAALEIGDVATATESLDALKAWQQQHVAKLQSNVHNGKPMTPRLRAQVAKEVKAMNAAVAKLENDLIYADAPTQEEQANVDANVPTTDNVGGTTTDDTEVRAEQQAPQAVAEDAPAAEANQEQVTAELREIFQELDSDPALVDQVVTGVLDLNEQGVTFDSALTSLKEQYGENTIKAAEESLAKLFPTTRESLAGRMTTPEGGGLKIPVMPEGLTAKEKSAFARSYNWITAYFKPKTSKGNILQSVPNLVSGPMATSVANFLGRDLTNDEAGLVKDFQSKHGHFKKSFDKLFAKNPKKLEFRDNDPSLFLADFDEENISTAIWAGSYNWIATRGGDTLFNDNATINTMLGRDSKNPVSSREQEVLGRVGVGRNTLAETLGRDIMNLLHIQTTGQAPHHLDSKMANSVGLLAAEIMRDMKVLTSTSVDGKTMAALTGKEATENSFNFYRIKTQKVEGKEVVAKSLKGIADTLRQANNSVAATSDRMWTNIFNGVAEKKAPSFSPIKKVAKTVKGSDQKITKKEQDIIRRQQNRKHFVRDDEWAAFSSLGYDNMARILGQRDENLVHVSQRESQANINDNIERELANFEEFVHMRDESGKEHFYFEHSKWTNGRYGIESTLVNPQGIKSHRAFIGQEGWVSTIDPANGDNRWFWASMLEPLSIGNREQALEKFGPVIEAMRVFVRDGEFNPEDVDMITEAVANAGHKAESFTALMNLAKYEEAAANNETFRTDMAIEIDGKTNGVILSMLQYADGANAKDLLARLGKGGFYAGEYNNFNEFKADGNLDAYEEIAKVWMNTLQNSNMDQKTLRGAQFIFGLLKLQDEDGKRKFVENIEKGGRNLAKSPLMVTNYGSGDQSVQEALGRDFIERIYDMITENPENYELIARAVNAIVPNSMPATTGAPLEVVIDRRAEQLLRNFIEEEFGKPVSAAINDQYARTKAGQKAVNEGLDLMFRMHNAVRNDLIAKATAQGIADGSIVKGVTTLSAEKMQEIDDQIKVLSPQMKTFFSKANTDFNHNMDLSGDRIALKQDSSAYVIEAQYTEGGNRVVAQSDVRVPSSPGVAGGVTTIHSLDALIMAMVYEGDVDVLGVHDAILVGVKDAQAGGEALNKATYDAMNAMTVPQEILRSYTQARKAFGAYLGRDDVDTKALMKDFYNAEGTALRYRNPRAGQFAKPIEGQKAAEARVNDLRATARRSLEIKDEVLKTPDLIVHQYADEIGQTGVTFNSTNVEEMSDTQVENVGKESARSVDEIVHEALYKANVPSEDLGSQPVTEETSPTQYDSEQVVDATNVQQVFDELPATGGKQENEAHKNFLREQVNHFSNMLMTPFKLHMRTKEDAPNYGVMTDSDIYLTNLAQGAQVTSGMLARGIPMSNQEVMAHELNHLVYLEGLSKDSKERRQVERMFQAAREQLDHTAFLTNPATASADEIEGAKATFNHLFYERSGQSLAEFAAFGTTNERFMEALGTVTLRPNKVFSDSFGEIFRNILNTIVDALSTRVLGLKGLRSDQQIVKMLDGMHRINAKKRHAFMVRAEKLAYTYQGAIAKPVNLVGAAVKKALTSDALLNNRFPIVAGPAKFLKLADDKKATEVFRAGLTNVRDNLIGTRNGFFVSTMDEIIGRTKGNAQVRDLARSANVQLDQERKKVKTAMIDNIKASFKTEMSDDDWTAVSKVFLKGDITRLLGLGTNTILELLDNPAAVDTQINRLESQLAGNVNANFYIRQARNLGYYMNTGKSREKVALLNAYNIARVAGNPGVRVSDAVINNVEPIIDQLATLHAMKEMNTEYRNQAANVLRREMAEDADNNGITAVLMAHAGLKEQSKQQFSSLQEYKALAIKGWTKEVYKEGVGLETGTAEDHDALVAQGFIRGARIANDPTDPVQEPRWIYHAPDGALAPYMSTIASLTNDVAKGSGRREVNKKWGATSRDEAATIDTIQINKAKIAAMKEMNARPNGPTGPSQENYMIPIVNPKGEFTDWRYMMSEANKDGLLQKDNNAAEILGSMAGNVVDKVESRKVNKELVNVTKEYWDREGATRSKAYVEIGPHSDNARYREIWAQLPESMQEEVRKVWGGNSFKVRADLVTHMFGYRKASLTELFQKDPEARKWYERLVTDMLTALFGDRAARYVRNAENFLQALTQEVKDVVIVKSGVITIANMLSNTMLLVMNGMSPAKALRYQYEAYRNSSEMIKEQRQVKVLTSELTTKSLSSVERRRKEAEIARLNRRISQNPTYEAYSAGLMPTIVEDVAADTEFTNTLRGKAQRAVSSGIDRGLKGTPSWVREGVKTVVGLPDTEVYRFMNNMVMQSDFMARYAILKDWTEKNGGVSTPEMFGEAEELFVNFDAPTHKGLQYLNDIGIAWFSKYVLRVNRSIARTFAKNPVAATLAVIGVEASGIGIDNPAASSVFGGGDITRIVDNAFGKAMDATDLSMMANIFGLAS
ncbi:virion RNA polymerase [Vibrio phage VBP47]|uniref:Virion RNA polymerase n=1 Tax=Vibrio phage VBP47 TaxID=754073 RepID=M4T2K7_9CAUD|nr:virion RNA polymerase [Vibrio phage VBP47]AGH57069.1 hypothetical protein VPNG_00045 [Vibrio phage VBP47]